MLEHKRAMKPKKIAFVAPGLFWFLPFGPLRDAAEILLASLPGAAMLALFILIVGGLTINFNSNGFAASYIPVVCLLPLVVGIVTPLVLERIRGEHRISLRRAMICSCASGLSGSFFASAILILLGIFNPSFKPFGPSVGGALPLLFLFALIVGISTALAAAGGAVLVIFIQKVSKEKGG